ncbi:tRNA pseudouridine(55) synthase TruB [Patescibacteria group bacterium]|nr:tRNA pseudouridine(55) synthase TruB [Patescibacteria group bacterium]MBU4057684.1 tRNA pseudouridine(55) synthase TruB [Patescibacteria group bacterium]MBU4115817.1 tRNA pseudouridine(55) synthase TruB [Patescibacteria group bacterium]
MNIKNIILIDKPKRITSFDVIRILRRKLGIKKMGHAGTLDPLASGLMIIGINEGTKKLNEYLKLSKIYIADILIGIKTTTGDREGEIIKKANVNDIDEKKVKKILKEMKGKLRLQVPIYSAIKIKGKPLYEYARKGKGVEIPKKDMEILGVKLIKITDNKNDTFNIKIEISVSSGTYIRSIAEEFGERLGYPASLSDLRRIKIGDFDIKNAQHIADERR